MPFKLTVRGSSAGPAYDDKESAVRYAKKLAEKEQAMVEIWREHEGKRELIGRAYTTGQVIPTTGSRMI